MAVRTLALLLAVCSPASADPVRLDGFLRLTLAGFGRYESAPALFLQQPSSPGLVLPVPIPAEAVMAVEQALKPARPAMLEVILHAQAVSKRDDALFDNLPWQWNPSPQAKRVRPRLSNRGARRVCPRRLGDVLQPEGLKRGDATDRDPTIARVLAGGMPSRASRAVATHARAMPRPTISCWT